MTRAEALPDRAESNAYFERHHGIGLDALLASAQAHPPGGHGRQLAAARAQAHEARRADDTSLPMGQWQHEIKRADWAAVSSIVVAALRDDGMDLQLAAWLLEAEMQQRGIEGLAPVLQLIEGLIDRHWDQLHPSADDGDLTHRANILNWINRKLLVPLKLVPLTQSGQARECRWADLEYARRLEQHRQQSGSSGPAAADDEARPNLRTLSALLAATPPGACQALHASLRRAIGALAGLSKAVDRRFDADAPSLSAFGDLLNDMRSWIEAELRRRGIAALADPVGAAGPEVAELAADDDDEAEAIGSAAARGEAPRLPFSNPHGIALRTPATSERDAAYAMLADAADALRRIEPHSPVPYVVQRAIAWGALNTAELYEELFIRQGGQISIFEMLGLAVPQESAA